MLRHMPRSEECRCISDTARGWLASLPTFLTTTTSRQSSLRTLLPAPIARSVRAARSRVRVKL
jgi:hypothetical protein